jgi:hypothetical protein
MSTLLWILLSVALIFYGAWRDRHLVRAAFIEGKRAGLKEAVEIAKIHADVAYATAPAGNLALGLARAAAVHRVQLEVLTSLVQVK